jgi:hypothetical protein
MKFYHSTILNASDFEFDLCYNGMPSEVIALNFREESPDIGLVTYSPSGESDMYCAVNIFAKKFKIDSGG